MFILLLRKIEILTKTNKETLLMAYCYPYYKLVNGSK